MPIVEIAHETKLNLRMLRLWHWKEAMRSRRIANQQRKNAEQYGEGCDRWKIPNFAALEADASADFHIKCVQTLNDFFLVGDTAENDSERERNNQPLIEPPPNRNFI